MVRLTFTDEAGVSYRCTGTAVNSERTRDDNLDAPYVMTAEHCIGSQTLADSVETRWHYEHENCDGSDSASDFTELHGGAELVVNDPDSDNSLLRLRDALPNNACLAGWSSDGGWARGTEVTSLHHPGGDPKQWAGGNVDATVVVAEVDSIQVTWTEGQTLGGSSGAGLFTTVDSTDVLVGTLSGGPACTVAEPIDYYGRFDRFFDNHAGVHLQHTDPPSEDDHGDTVARASPAVVGSEVAGEIGDGADADVFRIVVLRRGTLTVYTTGSVDTVGRLKREDGSTVAFNDDAYPNDTNFRIEADVSRGTYYAKVTGYDETSVGSYRLVVEFVAAESKILVPLFLAAAALERDGRQGFVRVVNHSDRAGDVRIVATDDAGTSPDAVILSLEPDETQAFNSQDLEEGNADKGLSTGTGAGTGDWRLEFDSELEIEVGAFVRTTDGFLSAVHDVVTVDEFTDSYYVPVFNPASNVNQRSRLRLINPDQENALSVTITARDDAGAAGESAVELQLDAGSARTLNAPQLEAGAEGLSGAFGDGRGKWRLFVESDGEMQVVNLLDSVTGDLTNLSARGADNFSD